MSSEEKRLNKFKKTKTYDHATVFSVPKRNSFVGALIRNLTKMITDSSVNPDSFTWHLQ